MMTMTMKDLVLLHPRMTERATILCADGWSWIIDRFLTQVTEFEKMYSHEGEFRLLFAGEHMAELAMQVDYGDGRKDRGFVDYVLDAFDSAVLRSRHYCEVCGERGELRCDELGWLTVSCDEHADPDTVVMETYNWRQVGGRLYELDPVTGTVTMRGKR